MLASVSDFDFDLSSVLLMEETNQLFVEGSLNEEIRLPADLPVVSLVCTADFYQMSDFRSGSCDPWPERSGWSSHLNVICFSDGFNLLLIFFLHLGLDITESVFLFG
jgi:hypothetical protein